MGDSPHELYVRCYTVLFNTIREFSPFKGIDLVFGRKAKAEGRVQSHFTRAKAMLDADPAPMLLDYKRGMEEIRLRLDSVALRHNDVAAMGTIEAPASRFRLETGFMHLRKVLELIAFSSLIAHNDVYVAAYKNDRETLQSEGHARRRSEAESGLLPNRVRLRFVQVLIEVPNPTAAP